MFIHDGIDDTKILPNTQKIYSFTNLKKLKETRMNINSLIDFIDFDNTAFIYFTSVLLVYLKVLKFHIKT